MKQHIVLIFWCITFFGFGQTIDTIFRTMSDELLPAFSEVNKTMLLVDTSLSVIPYPLGKIEKLEYTESFLSMKTSEVGTLQLKLLPLVNNSKIISVVKTVCSKKICDSDVRFFTDKWEEIDKKSLLPDIQPEVFFDSTQLNSLDFKIAASHIHIYPLHFQFNKENDDLLVTFDFNNALSPEDFKKIEPFVEKKAIVLQWNKAMFVH